MSGSIGITWEACEHPEWGPEFLIQQVWGGGSRMGISNKSPDSDAGVGV